MNRQDERVIEAICSRVVVELLSNTTSISARIFDSVFHIKCGNCTGTAFKMQYPNMIDDNGLLFTAAHIVEDLFPRGADRLYVRTDKGWRETQGELIGINESRDVAVLSCNIPQDKRIQYISRLVIAQGIVEHAEKSLGSEVQIFGYPMKLGGGVRSDGWPRAVVHRGNLSGVYPENDPYAAMIDGSLTKGFSGGPVVSIVTTLGMNPHVGVIGIVTKYTPDMGENSQNHQGMFLATGVSSIKQCEWLEGAPEWIKSN